MVTNYAAWAALSGDELDPTEKNRRMWRSDAGKFSGNIEHREPDKQGDECGARCAKKAAIWWTRRFSRERDPLQEGKFRFW